MDFTTGAISEEIFKCIDISYSLLSDKNRESILVFAPFTSFLDAMLLDEYLKALKAGGEFAELTMADLTETLDQAAKQGLLKEVRPKCFSIQPVFPFFASRKVEQDFSPGSRRES